MYIKTLSALIKTILFRLNGKLLYKNISLIFVNAHKDKYIVSITKFWPLYLYQYNYKKIYTYSRISIYV